MLKNQQNPENKIDTLHLKNIIFIMVGSSMYICLVTLGIIFLFLDLYKKNLLFLVISMSFLFSATILHKFPTKPYLSLLLLPVFCVVFYFLINLAMNSEKENKLKESSLDDFIGKTATVTKDIGKTLSIDGIGQISYNQHLWKAKNIIDKEIKKGTEVEIVSKENLIMNVKVKV